ncbi:uncharacterized protein LOC126737918 isoform X1 [Anthonomus grandis grandis]|uniref:uncharacterized protein LOC126737918 isoform X1 n=1 Tax=Anthonomus grandis grandis TaxID=2921223 RepID=UPI002166B146|nr:uncharacterized protein LOC126737918 isoform X1 [Anthonomus grandis grandis]
MDPPPCVQNAMMTKDKKPFTYTPGGIDLSQVRSPRMQRRIERNATLGGDNEVPRPAPPPPQNHGPLPPSALAAMRPQTQVQVFPGPPPPPPMQKNIPPPPPPPCAPLPTQKVTTSENQVIERPDMTKIIPDNPMSLLRKTGGPAPRKSFVDQMYENQNRGPPSPPQRNFEPPVVVPPVVQPQQYQPSQQYQPQYQSQRAAESPRSPVYSPEVHERQPPTPPTQKNVGSNVGSLYIPPINQQPQKMASPPTPPERRAEQQVQSPGTPTLKEAPRPWQQKNVQQEIPPWARKDNTEESPSTQSTSNVVPNMQQRWQPQVAPPQPVNKQPQQFAPRSPQTKPQTPPNQGYPSNSFPVHIEIRTSVPYQGESEPTERKPNAVYVTQPLVLQHPGPGVEPTFKVQPKQQPSAQQPNHYEQPTRQPPQPVQSPKIDSSGARIIPIQIERTPPSTPAGDRNLNRQMSWGNQPTQSNAFKVIQKFTNTEDEEEDDTPVTHHSARFPQEMPEQVRRMKVQDNGQFRQGNGHPSQQQYVHPSEQVVPEPKKYMGSNIPSRSFKILQAMTAPNDNNNCANANNNDEPKFNPTYFPYAYPPPPYPPPYWHDYYANFSLKEQSERSRSPYWQDPYYPTELSESTSKMSDKSGRSTPIFPPYWMPPPPPPYVRSRSTTPKPENTLRPNTPKHNSDIEEQYHYPMYPPYFDPYYFSYFYGYPPMMMQPRSHYSSSVDNDEQSGYSSMDEMSNYHRRNSSETNSVQALRQQFELRSKSAAPRITIIPTYVKEDDKFNVPPDKEEATTIGGLRSIKSVQNINVYHEEDSSSSESEYETDSEDDSSEDETQEEEEEEEEIIPHQLSVIYEESERRCNSVCSESTTIAEQHSEEEDYEDFLANQNVKFKINMFQETSVTRNVGIESFKEESDTFSSFTISRNAKHNKVEVKDEYVEVDTSEDVKGHSFKENEDSDSANEKAETVIEKEEVVCVKLRSKNVPVELNSLSATRSLAIEPEETSRDAGTLMRIDSFVRQFEDIKRNSGLWSFEAAEVEEEGDLESDEEELTHVQAESSVQIQEDVSGNSELSNVDAKQENDSESESEEEDHTISIEEENNLEHESEEIKKVEPLEASTNINKESNLESETEELVQETTNNLEDESSAESEIDFWSQIKNDDDDFTPRRRSYYRRDEDEPEPVDSSSSCERAIDPSQLDNLNTIYNEINDVDDDESDSEEETKKYEENTIDESGEETAVEHCEPCKPNDITNVSDDESESSCSESEDEAPIKKSEPEEQKEVPHDTDRTTRSKSLEPQTIKERIEALQNSIARRQSKVSEKEILLSVKQKVSAFEAPNSENVSKTTSTKSSVKSFDEYSEEEEPDSGVISDISRHISDNEEFPELRKMTRYERAATHSRLFKLLQEECDVDDKKEQENTPKASKEDKFSKLSVRKNRESNQLTPSRSKLSLPLVTKCNETSDITTTTTNSSINEKLVDELVQSLLRSRKAQIFRNMPKEKLYSAAVRILQEGVSSTDTPSEEFSSLLSPLRGDTENSSPAQTPQEFYGESEYRQYYDTWSDAAMEIMPSKAFKLLQDHLGGSKPGAIEGISAKCPRILSSKNLLKTLEGGNREESDCSSSLAYPLPEANEVTKT